MPIYEFQCNKCEKITERWQSHNDPAPESCEHCGGKLSKIISRTTFHLKGTGWYVTDYCKKDGNGSASKDSSKDTCSSSVTPSSDASKSSSQTSAQV